MSQEILSGVDERPVGHLLDKDTAAAAFLARVGRQVRAARARAGMSRRVLSQRSGVSQRYLAQLEGGGGNVSIALLRRIAASLGIGVDRLVAEEDPEAAAPLAVATLFQQASADQRERVLEILDPRRGPGQRAGRIALIGLRGAGKSTLGRLAADRLGLAFLELNDEIERDSGMPVGEVIALYGQEGYRRLEHRALQRIAGSTDRVMLAVAGGIVAEKPVFDYLLRRYHTVWLKARPEEHMARVRAQGDERPMAGNPDAMKELRVILTDREVQYARAAAEVSTSRATVDESLEALLQAVRAGDFLIG